MHPLHVKPHADQHYCYCSHPQWLQRVLVDDERPDFMLTIDPATFSHDRYAQVCYIPGFSFGCFRVGNFAIAA